MKFTPDSPPEDGQNIFIAGTDLEPNKIVKATYSGKSADERGSNEIGSHHLSKWLVFDNESEAIEALIDKLDD
ncbi:hypothetical protein [Marinigracilibium pacificum]|uniref:Uncharacterized protein n=1 Tax=Marinigracilibium pacificum TaxID=2729599 RepID=A0A848J2R1_9BACT|nr:hypothetical protein [Marinigracilibium pacificum]NMM50056.1 hypothetical protein [Marinigracilibium pacificum]